jgi:hypothetical protein
MHFEDVMLSEISQKKDKFYLQTAPRTVKYRLIKGNAGCQGGKGVEWDLGFNGCRASVWEGKEELWGKFVLMGTKTHECTSCCQNSTLTNC